ncbi:carbohydrate-binding X8 domain superfamily protein [Striga asiatica]|uniref:Carbohydrate-binding X8 domain superfamily protein n=1 Tax=Striga asiatica TaxID=4170 RepID=A0A5A7QY76_STRAF|nr:carbohydrate-binding X8 domain superfamily protein [Striga asiatica]
MAGRLSLFIAIFLVAIVVTSCTTKSKQDKTWCVIKQIAPADKMQAYIDSACKEYDCKEIRQGGSCYEPRTLANHASYVLNLDYRATGRCNSDIGTTAITDPSFGTCHYP